MFYSIRDVENLTGIKAHTLRIWEQRYKFITPHRTDTRIRFYDADQLKYLLNISSLLKSGYKVSHISAMTPDEIARLVNQIATGPAGEASFYEVQVSELIKAMLDLNEKRFEEVVEMCLMRIGFEGLMLHVLIPLMERVGVLWASGQANVAQEHFISNLVRRKIIVAIDQLKNQQISDQEKYLLFLPEGEMHELGLLFSKYIIKSRGRRTLYLGQSMPYEDLKKIIMQSSPDYLFTALTSTINKDRVECFLQNLLDEFPHLPLIVTGGCHQYYKLKGNVIRISDAESLIRFVNGDRTAHFKQFSSTPNRLN
ncbi:MAG: MerR family transcriptional regulator [Flavobacteriales bacterium]|nr:MerR family transcriptional regulator [Flavobacteriales bacterium]